VFSQSTYLKKHLKIVHGVETRKYVPEDVAPDNTESTIGMLSCMLFSFLLHMIGGDWENYKCPLQEILSSIGHLVSY